MSAKIFINLPVKDLNNSVEFFTKLGFTFNPQFTNKEATKLAERNAAKQCFHDKFMPKPVPTC